MVYLVRLLDLSPCGWSVVEVTQRQLVLFGTRLPGSSPVFFCTSAPLVGFVSQSVPQDSSLRLQKKSIGLLMNCASREVLAELAIVAGKRRASHGQNSELFDVGHCRNEIPGQLSASLQPSSFWLLTSALVGQFAFALAMFPGDFVSQFASALPVSLGDLELDALFEGHGVSWLAIDEMFALEWATYRRCFPAQPPLSFWQRYNKRKMCSPPT